MSYDSKIVSNKIIIYGLLNKYNFELDLDKRLNVLIGENGAGKTTTQCTRYRYGGNGGNFLKCLVFSMVLDYEIRDCMKMVPGSKWR